MLGWNSLAYLCADTFVFPFDSSLFLLCLSFFLTDTASGLLLFPHLCCSISGGTWCVCVPAWWERVLYECQENSIVNEMFLEFSVIRNVLLIPWDKLARRFIYFSLKKLLSFKFSFFYFKIKHMIKAR